MKKLISIVAIVVIIIIIVALAGKKDDAMPVLDDQAMETQDEALIEDSAVAEDAALMEAGVDTVIGTEATPAAE